MKQGSRNELRTELKTDLKTELKTMPLFSRHRETSSLMAKTCPSSCGKCVKRGVESEIENVPVREKRAICKDNKAKCETWATHGMCK